MVKSSIQNFSEVFSGTKQEASGSLPKKAGLSVVYKQVYDTSRGGRTKPVSHAQAQHTIQVAFLRKDASRKINYTMSMGVHRNEFLVLKIIFILFINGEAQEGKHDFIKLFFFQWGYENFIL